MVSRGGTDVDFNLVHVPEVIWTRRDGTLADRSGSPYRRGLDVSRSIRKSYVEIYCDLREHADECADSRSIERVSDVNFKRSSQKPVTEPCTDVKLMLELEETQPKNLHANSHQALSEVK